MIRFRWQGVDSLGLPQQGELTADSKTAAEQQLKSIGISGLHMHSVAEHVRSPGSLRELRWTFNSRPANLRVRRKDLGIFSGQFADLLAAGIPVLDAIETLEEGRTGNFAVLLRSLKESLNQGLTLADAMAKHPRVFDACYINLVECEQVAGKLHRALATLAAQIEHRKALTQRLRQSMLQPGLILVTALAATGLLLVFVMPEFAALYRQQSQELPAITQWVMKMSEEAQMHAKPAMAGLVVTLIAAYLLYQNSVICHRLVDRALLALPLFGSLIRCSNITDLSRTLSALLDAGVPLNQGLEHSSSVCRNAVFRRAIEQAKDQIENGAALHQALAWRPCFPTAYQRIVRLGEETGNLSHMLNHACKIYEAHTNRVLDTLVPMIEPILMVILGIVVGGLILAMYLPIFSMGTLFQA